MELNLTTIIQVLYGLPGPLQFVVIILAVACVLGTTFALSLLFIRTIGFWAYKKASQFINKLRTVKVDLINPVHASSADAFGNVDLQDDLLGKVIVADLREHMRAWGSLCAGLLQMVYSAKQMHPELFHHISAAQDRLAAAGQKIANCYEKNTDNFNEALCEISHIRNEFGVAIRAYQLGREGYIAALQKAHARSDGAAKEALSNLRSFSH